MQLGYNQLQRACGWIGSAGIYLKTDQYPLLILSKAYLHTYDQAS